MDAQKARKRVSMSKNRKKYWKKHADVKDIEEYLEDKRLDERIGGAKIEKPNEELFFVDKGLDVGDEPQPKKKKNWKKPLRSFQNLASDSLVVPPIQSHRVRSQDERKPRPVLEKQRLKLARKLDERQRSRELKKCLEEKAEVSNGTNFYDMWTEEPKDTEKKAAEASLDPDLEHYVKEYTKLKQPKRPERLYQKPSLVDSVEVPHAGASYNPAFEEHQELLRKAVEVEEKREKEEQHIDRVLTQKFPTKDDVPTEATRQAELLQGLFVNDEEIDVSEDEVANGPMNPPVRAEDRKPKKKKRREKKALNLMLAAKRKKEERNLSNEIYRLKAIKEEIKRHEMITRARVDRNQQREIEKMYNPRTLSKHKFENPEIELKLSDELAENLVNLKPEGSLLEDRYKSLQKRNIIETRVKQNMKRKYKLKKFEKRDHKNFV